MKKQILLKQRSPRCYSLQGLQNDMEESYCVASLTQRALLSLLVASYRML